MTTADEALNTFLSVWGAVEVTAEFAAPLTCTEVEALATLLDATGYTDEAASWRSAHSERDEKDDLHFRSHDTTAGEYIVPTDPMDAFACESCQ